MACPHIQNCSLYSQFKVNSLLTIWKAAYCEGKFQDCVRFQKSCSGDQVPSNLLPNGRMLGDAPAR
jgi:hypothetical protein